MQHRDSFISFCSMSGALCQILVKEDEFLFNRHYKKILEKVIDKDSKDFNFDLVSAREISTEKLLTILQTQPWMSPFRTVVLEDIESFNKSDWEALLSYVQNPSPTTHFILIGTKIDKRIAFFKAFVKIGGIFEFKTPYDNQIPGLIKNEAREMGLRLEEGCAELLVEIAGTNLLSLITELEKLETYIHPGKTVTKKHVADLVCAGILSNVFLISKLLAEKRYFETAEIYSKLEQQGEVVQRLVPILVAHFRKLLLLKSSGDRMNSASLLGVPPYFLKEYEEQARGFTGDHLKKIYKKLMRLSIDLRSLPVSGSTLFGSFIQDTCLS